MAKGPSDVKRRWVSYVHHGSQHSSEQGFDLLGSGPVVKKRKAFEKTSLYGDGAKRAGCKAEDCNTKSAVNF